MVDNSQKKKVSQSTKETGDSHRKAAAGAKGQTDH
jgi:hypothetical protein